MDTQNTTQTCTGTSSVPATELLTIPAAAKRLTVSVRSIYRLIEYGELAVVRILPDAPRIRATDIDALITRRLTETDAPFGTGAGERDSKPPKKTV